MDPSINLSIHTSTPVAKNRMEEIDVEVRKGKITLTRSSWEKNRLIEETTTTYDDIESLTNDVDGIDIISANDKSRIIVESTKALGR